jgi:hypothetical protein
LVSNNMCFQLDIIIRLLDIMNIWYQVVTYLIT